MHIDEIKKFRKIITEGVEPLDENIEYGDSGADDLSRSLNSLIKFNNGVFKSQKQRHFLLKMLKNYATTDHAMAKQKFNVEAEPEDLIVPIIGWVRWANYGSRSVRPVGKVYIIDNDGVKKQYKLKWKEVFHQNVTPTGSYRRSRTSNELDPTATKVEWTRPDNVEVAHLVEPTTPAPGASPEGDDIGTHVGNHFGTPGQRYKDVEMWVDSSHGPITGNYGDYYINKLRDIDGNKFIYFGNKLGERGDNLRLSFTVFSHTEDKKEKTPLTQIKRPAIAKAPKQVNSDLV